MNLIYFFAWKARIIFRFYVPNLGLNKKHFYHIFGCLKIHVLHFALFCILAKFQMKKSLYAKKNDMVTYWFFLNTHKMSGVEYIPAKYEVCYKIWKLCIFFTFFTRKINQKPKKSMWLFILNVNMQSQCTFNKYIIWLENTRTLTSKIVCFEFLFFWNGYHGNKNPIWWPPFFIPPMYSEFLKYPLCEVLSNFYFQLRYEVGTYLFKNVAHSLESGETPSSSASNPALNYIQRF